MYAARKFINEASRKATEYYPRSLRISRLGLLAALLIAWSGAARAATINVPADYATIQAAITASTTGDTVIVAPGTYTGAGNVDIDFGGKNINVESSGGAATTIIDCQGSRGTPHKGFYIHTGETAAVVQGFTIQDGYDANVASGVAVLAATATIRQCVIQNCAGRLGGAVSAACKSASPYTQANVTVTACILRNNGGYQGAGLYVNASTVSVLQCDFLSNVASSTTSATSTYGGAIEITKNNPNTVTDSVADCVFISNTTQADGGAIDMSSNDTHQTVNIFNCSFYGNNAGAAGKGTIDFFRGTNTVKNCIFYGDLSSKEISTVGPPAAATMQYCDIHQTGYAGVHNCVNADPLYVDPANKDLHLQINSTCIAAGDSTGAPATDHDSTPWTTNVSLGAFDAHAALPATHFSVSAPTSATAGASFTVTVTALDVNEGTVTGYTGRVHLTSSDAAAAPPANSTLTNGVGTFIIALKTAGNQTITATDTVANTLTGMSPAIAVAAAAASHLSVTAPGAATAGVAITATVTALDTYGNTDTNYAGAIHFTTTDGAAVSPADGTLTSGIGSYSVIFKTAGSQRISATDTLAPTITGVSGAVPVSGAAASQFVVTAPTSATAGVAVAATITAKDPFGNTDTHYAGAVHFTSSDAVATLPTDGTLSAGAGSVSVTFRTVGNQTLAATDTVSSSITGVSGAVSVNPAPPMRFVVAAPNSATAGAPVASTVTAQDAFGNVATGYTGTVHLTSSDRQAVLPADAALTNGVGTFMVTLETAGNQTVAARDTVASSVTGVSGAVAVTAAGASRLTVTAPGSATAGASVTVVVTAKDAYGNTDLSYADTVHFTSTDPSAILPADSLLTNGAGTFSVTLLTAGSQRITATDTLAAPITGSSGSIAVGDAGANHFLVSTPLASVMGSPLTVTVTVKDAYENTVAGYAGAVHITTTDGAAVLPADGALPGGSAAFSVTLFTVGTQSITVTDTVTTSLTGSSGAIAVSPAPAVTFIVTAHGSVRAGVGFAFYVIAKDVFGNTVTGYTGTVHFSSGDRQAVLPGNTTLTNGVGWFQATLKTAGPQTIVVSDAAAPYVRGASSPVVITPSFLLRLILTAHGNAKEGIGFWFSTFAVDAYGNTVPTYTGTVHFSSTDPHATLPADTTLVNGAGLFTAVLNTTGRQTIHGVDTVRTDVYGTCSVITVSGGRATIFVVTPHGAATSGSSFSFAVIAKDALGNIATSYTGPVRFTSTDGAAVLPASAMFVNGIARVTATLKTPGSQTITVTDSANSVVKGVSTPLTVTSAAP